MRIPTRILRLIAVSLLFSCGGGSSPTGPTSTPTMPGNGGGASNGGGGSSSSSAAVTIGNNFFRSGQEGSVNPAVVTITAGGTVTWTWGNNGSSPHNVQSIGSPSFVSSSVQSATGSTYQVTFPTAGTYHYNCIVHGNSMTGTVIVQ
jgi:plastocyanin